MAEGSPTSLLHLSITRWELLSSDIEDIATISYLKGFILVKSITIADNFYLCDGCTIPRWLLYEMYIENFSSDDNNKVNPATFGKLIRLVFPGLGTRRLGTRGSTRYHYDGIAIKEDSSLYGHYCFLLPQKNCHSKDLHCFPSVTYLKTEEDGHAYVLPEFRLAHPWEQELLNKYPYEMVIQIANEYSSHCQDILQAVKMQELDEVEDCITSFWRFLQPEKIAFISSPDICQLFKYYDRYLFKEMSNILLGDFLEEVSVHYLKTIRMFSKNVKLWLLNALKELPMPLQTAKCEEVTLFIKRLRRMTDLSNMAKTMRIVLNNNSKVAVLVSDLNAVIDQGLLDVPGNLFQKKYGNPDELQNSIEIKCLNDLLSSLARSTDIRVLLSCVSSNLQAFVIQPSRSKQEFRKLAAEFQLRWNFLLSTVSKEMTLNYADSFGSWHLFYLLLLDYVAHVFQSCIDEEEEGEGGFCVTQQSDQPVLWVYEPSYFEGCFAEEEPQAEAPQSALISLMLNQSDIGLSNVYSEF